MTTPIDILHSLDLEDVEVQFRDSDDNTIHTMTFTDLIADNADDLTVWDVMELCRTGSMSRALGSRVVLVDKDPEQTEHNIKETNKVDVLLANMNEEHRNALLQILKGA